MLKFMWKPQSAAMAFLASGAFWFAVGTTYGMICAIQLVSPEFLANVSWLVFGRDRPIHVNTVLYGFATTTLIGAGLYYVPAVLKTRLWSEPLGWAAFFLWTAAMISPFFTFSFGMSQGREYAEHLWIFDLCITVAVVICLINVVMTILNRTENSLYVSVWYFTGTFLWMSAVYPIGNVMWHPSTGAMPGLIDSVFLWFYGHNLPGLLLTPLATGAAYFVIPRVVKAPLFSHMFSLIGFWTLLALYTHIGGHHILQAPIPDWLKVFSVVDSVAMVIPVFVVLSNLWMTARGRGGRLLADPAGRFVLAGSIWYLITCIQGPVQSLPYVQRITHFNNWVIGHSHIAVFGFAGFIALGAFWHIVPLVLERQVYSNRLINLQFGLVLFGLAGFFAVLTPAGLIQGEAWYNGETVYRVLPEIVPYMALRAFSGTFILTGAYLGLYNLVMTMLYGQRYTPAEIEEEAA